MSLVKPHSDFVKRIVSQSRADSQRVTSDE